MFIIFDQTHENRITSPFIIVEMKQGIKLTFEHPGDMGLLPLPGGLSLDSLEFEVERLD